MAKVLDFFIRLGVEGKDQVKRLADEIDTATKATQGFNEAALNSAGLLMDLGAVGALTEGVLKLKELVFPSIPVNDIIALAEKLGVSAEKAKELQNELKLPTEDITYAVDRIKQLNSLEFSAKDQFQMLSEELGITIDQFDKLSQLSERGKLDSKLDVGKAVKSVATLATGYNNVETAVKSMIAKVNPAYNAMIESNERLNQQLLQSAATITATSKVQGADGKTLQNLASIRALQPELKKSIKEVEIATLSLVGVTSEQTSGVFNIILQNTGQLNGQLKAAAGSADKFKDPLDAAAKLAPGLVATLGTLGLDMGQAADEVGNLLKGEIDSTAQVAKSLGITREMIENWKSQGVLVQKLTEKFDPFIKANAEAAKSVKGISSNIQDMFEITTREAGKPIASLFVNALSGVEQFLKKIIPEVQKVMTSVIERQVTTISVIGESLKPVIGGIMSAIGSIAPSIGPAIIMSLVLIENLFKSLTPLFSFVGSLIASIGTAVGSLIPVFLRFNESFGFIRVLTIFINVVSTVLGPVLQVVAVALNGIANTIAAIANNPLGALLLQVIALTAAIAPLIVTLVKIQLLVTSFGAITAYLSGAIAGIQTLIIVAGQTIPAVGAIISAFGALKVAVGAAFGALVSGGISAAVLSLKASMLLLSASFSAALASAVPFLLALAPLLAIGGAIAITLAVKGAKDLENVQKELDDLRSTTNNISDNALKNAEKLKALADAAAKGGLTKKQLEEQKQLIFGGKQQIKLIEDQIATVKKMKQEAQGAGASQEQLNQFDIQEKQLEKAKDTLSKYANAVKIASQDLAKLGTTNEQIAQKLKSAQSILDAGVGDPTKYKEAAKLQAELLEQQVKLGTITAEEGAKRLKITQNNEKLDYEAQLAAKEAIVKLYKTRFEKIEELRSSGKMSGDAAIAELEAVKNNSELEISIRKDAANKIKEIRKESYDADFAEIAAKQAEISAKQAEGAIGEAEAARQTTEAKVKESRIRIRQQQEELASEMNPEARRRIVAEIRKSQAELTKVEAEERERRNKERLKDFDEQEKIIQAALDKGRISEESYNQQRAENDEQRSQEELRQLDEKMKRLSATDKEGREAIAAQIAEAESKQEANRKAAMDRELATFQQSIDKQADLVRDAEAAKRLEVEKAIDAGVQSRAAGEAEIAKVAIDG
jgi:hypothetical protein